MRYPSLLQMLVLLKSRLISLVTASKRHLRHYGLVLVTLLLSLNCFFGVTEEGSNFSAWDWMQISGITVFIIGIWLAQRIPRELSVMLTRLVSRSVLLIDAEKLEQLKMKLEIRAQDWANRSGLISGVAILLAFLVSFAFRKIELMLLSAFAAYFAGRYLGRMASYGTLRLTLQKEALSLKVYPGHLDGASGFKPVGDFYFLQALLASLPATYLAIWWLVIPLMPKYSRWRESYLGLLIVAIAFELLVFVVPLWLFHSVMKEQKMQLLKDADSFSHSIFEIESQLIVTQTTQDREQLKEQLSNFSKRYWDIEHMLTWPVDIKILRRFSFNNLLLFIPLISKIIGNPTVWQNLEKLIHFAR